MDTNFDQYFWDWRNTTIFYKEFVFFKVKKVFRHQQIDPIEWYYSSSGPSEPGMQGGEWPSQILAPHFQAFLRLCCSIPSYPLEHRPPLNEPSTVQMHHQNKYRKQNPNTPRCNKLLPEMQDHNAIKFFNQANLVMPDL